jgi:hypothetical protein
MGKRSAGENKARRGCPFGDYSGRPFPKTEVNKCWLFFKHISSKTDNCDRERKQKIKMLNIGMIIIKIVEEEDTCCYSYSLLCNK